MALSYDLVSQFAKLVKDEKKTGTESIVYGTVVVDAHGDKYVKLDGSDQLTPLTDTSTNANDNERVSVLIKNHTATVTGNMSSPAARTGDVETLGDQVSEIQKFDIVLAEQIQANEGYIKQLQTDKANVGDLTAATAKITELETSKASIEQLNATKAEITDLVADKIDAEVVNAKFATIESLNATNADIANLEADYGTFKNLTADNLEAVDATIKNLDSTYATIENLEAEQARITDLETHSLTANSAEIKNLQADVADIDTLIFGSATGTTIQTSFANAVIAMLGNAQIKSAMIDSVAANKITAGDIITNNVRVLSEDGKLLISDETIQISDDTRVRVQIGKDASGDYSISIWDADGKMMFSEGGITDNAIKDAIIRNDMVSDDANISASKLDISSLFTEINNSTQTINANKVLIDTDAGTLDVAFTKMETDISGLSSDVSSQGTALSLVQGQISSKVWQEDITTAIESVDADIAAAQGAAEAAQATANQNASDMANIVNEFNKDVANLQTQIDGSIATWFYEVVPTNSNEPAKNWTTTELKNNHLGDLYYDTITGYCYRWQVQNNQYSWQRITDTDITKALADAAVAQDTADQKRRVFYSQPTVPYEQGDLWVQGAGGDILRCQTPKTNSQSYSVSDWVLASKYTDDTAANNAQNSVNTLTTKHSSLEQTVNGISATVGQHTSQIANKADSSTVTTVNNKVTELETSLDGFKSTVSDTYATKTSLEGVQSAAAQAQSKADQAAADAATAQETADSANTKLAQAEADLATAQQNLANVTSRVGATEEDIEAAQAAVTAAQTTANQAKADAATAQSTANTAKTNAANAQTAANNAKAAADAAQADVNALVTRVSTAETNISQNTQQIALRATKTEVTETLGGYYNKAQTEALIEETAEEINLSVSDVRTEVENINVGGRNLIADTSLDVVYSGSKGTSSYKDVWAAKTINIPTAIEYIVSFDAKADVAQNIRCYFYSPNTTTSSESSTGFTSNSIDGQAFVAITTEWKRYWVKWTQTPADAVKSVIVGRTETDNLIYIRAVKLEEGNRATSWSPAPEDFYTKEQTKAQIKIESDAITNTVSSTYATKTALSATDTKAGDAADAAQAAQNDIDNLNIGGRNLLLNTNGTGDIRVDGGEVATAGITQCSNDGVLTLTCSTQNTEIYYRFMNPSTSTGNLYVLKAGETYTISGKAMINVTGGTLTKLVVRTQAYRSGGWSGGIGNIITDASTNNWVEFEFPFTVESDATGYYVSLQIYYTGTFAAVAQFKDLKLEHGTRATDWSPAPEDVVSDISYAQNTANDALESVTAAETVIQQLSDSIAALVRDGNGGSLLRQDASGLWYFDISGIQESLSNTANDLSDLEGVVLDANGDIDMLKTTAAALQERTEYVRSYTDENDQPCLELGEGDSLFKVRITNTDIQFVEDTEVPTRINRKMLIIEKAMVRQELQFGDDQDASISGVWVWNRRANGNLGLTWKGVT